MLEDVVAAGPRRMLEQEDHFRGEQVQLALATERVFAADLQAAVHALGRILRVGAAVPGGMLCSWLCEMLVIWALAVSTLAPGCRNVLMMARPFRVTDSVCSMLLTTVVMLRSTLVVMRPSISSAFIPVYCQMEARTGMSIFGKMSVGVRDITNGLISRTSRASTMKISQRTQSCRICHGVQWVLENVLLGLKSVEA